MSTFCGSAVEIALVTLPEQEAAAEGEVKDAEAEFPHCSTTPKFRSEKSLREGRMADSTAAFVAAPFSKARMLWSARIEAS
jgi:hypothetical protein